MIFRLRILLFLSVFAVSLASALGVDHLGNALADTPKWKTLEKFQRTITHDEFEQLLRGVYCTRGLSDDYIRIDPDAACILTDRDAQTWFRLRFARSERDRRSATHTWRPARSLPKPTKAKPLL